MAPAGRTLDATALGRCGAAMRLARVRVSPRRDGGEGLRGVGRIPRIHGPAGALALAGLAARSPVRPRRRAVQVRERAPAARPAPLQRGCGHGRRFRVGGPAGGRTAGAGPARSRAAGCRTGRPFCARREGAPRRDHPALAGAGRIHPRQLADRLLGWFPGRLPVRLGAARGVEPVHGAERPDRGDGGFAGPARGGTVRAGSRRAPGSYRLKHRGRHRGQHRGGPAHGRRWGRRPGPDARRPPGNRARGNLAPGNRPRLHPAWKQAAGLNLARLNLARLHLVCPRPGSRSPRARRMHGRRWVSRRAREA